MSNYSLDPESASPVCKQRIIKKVWLAVLFGGKRSNRTVLVYRRTNPVTGKTQKIVIGNAVDFPRGSDRLQRAIGQIRSRVEKSPAKLAPRRCNIFKAPDD
ncbi:MAG TPA: hypothetical protein VNX88_23035 [Terriglobales bacterium]|nr:hypothetical protein [Terriglobales bacterium]